MLEIPRLVVLLALAMLWPDSHERWRALSYDFPGVRIGIDSNAGVMTIGAKWRLVRTMDGGWRYWAGKPDRDSIRYAGQSRAMRRLGFACATDRVVGGDVLESGFSVTFPHWALLARR